MRNKPALSLEDVLNHDRGDILENEESNAEIDALLKSRPIEDEMVAVLACNERKPIVNDDLHVL